MIESASEFVRLRRSERREDYVRAAHEAANIEVWEEIVATYPEMREWVAHNKTVPMPVLELLAADLDPRVRAAVAMKRKLSRTLFDALANDADGSVRANIAHNPKVPSDVLSLLCDDPEHYVAAIAKARVGA